MDRNEVHGHRSSIHSWIGSEQEQLNGNSTDTRVQITKESSDKLELTLQQIQRPNKSKDPQPSGILWVISLKFVAKFCRSMCFSERLCGGTAGKHSWPEAMHCCSRKSWVQHPFLLLHHGLGVSLFVPFTKGIDFHSCCTVSCVTRSTEKWFRASRYLWIQVIEDSAQSAVLSVVRLRRINSLSLKRSCGCCRSQSKADTDQLEAGDWQYYREHLVVHTRVQSWCVCEGFDTQSTDLVAVVMLDWQQQLSSALQGQTSGLFVQLCPVQSRDRFISRRSSGKEEPDDIGINWPTETLHDPDVQSTQDVSIHVLIRWQHRFGQRLLVQERGLVSELL